MKPINLKPLVLLAALAAALVLTFACSDDEDDPDGAAGAAGGTMPVTTALLDSLPDYDGATLVREWLVEGGATQVREYAVGEAPESAATAVTLHYRDALVKDGWQESEARAAVSAFTKDGRRIVIGRVGPQLQEPPNGAVVLSRADPPAGSGFFFTLEAEE